MKSVILIEHLNPLESNLLVERDLQSTDKTLWLNGIFMQADIKNRNNRTYPLQQISSAVKSANEKINETNGIFGELDHPQTLTINLDRISHVITEMKLIGQNAIGRAKILTTPMGNIARTLIESGVRMGVSSRGAGQVNEGVVDMFNFITADLVATPSAPNAMPDSIYESIDLSRNGNTILTLAEQVQQDPKAQQFLTKEISKFLTNMKWQKQ